MNIMAEMILPKRDRESVSASIEIEDITELMFGTVLEEDPEKKTDVDYAGKRIHMYLRSRSASGICPFCEEESCALHGKGFRHPQWMPIQGMTTYAHIELNRYKCLNGICPVKTFTEELDNVRRNQHRSDIVNTVILALSVFCSDIAAALICREMGITVSHDSINRILNHILVEDEPDIETIGVDDVCLRKGKTYHTVIYDGNDHHLLALLDGRDGKELKEWLKSHPKVHTVARDRASAYASAIKEVLPDCLQVADRFHLLQNLIGYLNDIFKANIPSQIFIRNNEVLDEAPEKICVEKYSPDSDEFDDIHYDNSAPFDEETGEIITYCDKNRFANKLHYRRLKESRERKYRMILELREEWNETVKPKKKDFTAKYGISLPALNKYLNMTDEEVGQVLEITAYKKRHTDMDDYLNIVYKMLRDHFDPAFIYSYILHIGYSGSRRSLESHIKALAMNNFGIRLGRDYHQKEQYPEDVTVISRFDVLKYMTIKDKEKMKGSDVEKYYSIIEEHYPAVKLCSEIWISFHDIIMGKGPDQLDDFLDKYEVSPIAPFINGIKKDIAPVKAAISSPVSSGFVEGGNCRYKATKRLMFGRSGLRHLFLKTYAVSIIMRSAKSVSGLITHWLNS